MKQASIPGTDLLVGDKVQIVNPVSSFANWVGRIQSIDPKTGVPYQVKFIGDRGKDREPVPFSASELKKVMTRDGVLELDRDDFRLLSRILGRTDQLHPFDIERLGAIRNAFAFMADGQYPTDAYPYVLVPKLTWEHAKEITDRHSVLKAKIDADFDRTNREAMRSSPQ